MGYMFRMGYVPIVIIFYFIGCISCERETFPQNETEIEILNTTTTTTEKTIAIGGTLERCPYPPPDTIGKF